MSSNLTAATIGHYPNGRGSRFRTGPVGVRISGALPYLAVYPNWQRGRVESAFSAGSNPATVTKNGRVAPSGKGTSLTKRISGVRPSSPTMRSSSNGRASAFQADDEGSIPSDRSKSMRVSGGRYSGSYPELSGFNSQARNQILTCSSTGRAPDC